MEWGLLGLPDPGYCCRQFHFIISHGVVVVAVRAKVRDTRFMREMCDGTMVLKDRKHVLAHTPTYAQDALQL